MEKKVRYGLIGVGVQGSAYAGFLNGSSGFEGMPAVECPPHCTCLLYTSPSPRDCS